MSHDEEAKDFAMDVEGFDESDESEDPRVTEVRSLVWSMLDETISADEIKYLEELIVEDEVARQTYIQCVRLHSDLQYYYAQRRAEESGEKKRPFADLPIELPTTDGTYGSTARPSGSPPATVPTRPRSRVRCSRPPGPTTRSPVSPPPTSPS